MSKQKYHELINQLCERLGIEDPASKYNACDLVVDDTAFTLAPGNDTNEECLFIYADFGAPPADKKQQALWRLLEVNLYMYGYNKPIFSLNPETEHVILAWRVPLSQLTLESLIKAMANVAEYVRVWQSTYFLTGVEREQGLQMSFQ